MNKEKLLDGAKLGDKFLTRDCRLAVYLGARLGDLNTLNIAVETTDRKGYIVQPYSPFGVCQNKHQVNWSLIPRKQITNYLEIFTGFPHLDGEEHIINDWGYTPSLYHMDANWFVSWVHCEEGDTLLDFHGSTPGEAIEKANEYLKTKVYE